MPAYDYLTCTRAEAEYTRGYRDCAAGFPLPPGASEHYRMGWTDRDARRKYADIAARYGVTIRG